MPWTTAARANDWVQGVDLALVPTALDASLTDAENDLYNRLIQFISKATVDTWTTTVNTPERVQYWCARMTAAIYLSKFQGYYLQPEIPDNPAAELYNDVLNELEEAKWNRIIIVDQVGDVVAVNGIGVTAPERSGYQDYRFTEWLPVSQGGDIQD